MSVQNTYLDMPCQDGCGELNNEYLNKINHVMQITTSEYNRVFAFRVDLRLPSDLDDYHIRHADDPRHRYTRRKGDISRFVESFKSIIKYDLTAKAKRGKRVCACNPRFIWCKERSESISYHYHLLILLNKDAYFTLGSFDADTSMAFKVMKAWASALGLIDVNHAKRLVHFPANSSYFIDRNSELFEKQYEDLFYRTSYLAKVETKEYGDKQRNFGYSLN